MPSPKHPQKKAAPKAKSAPNALAKPVRPDPTLAVIVGPEPLPRTELTKRVWEYIREHKLQDAQDRRRADPSIKAFSRAEARPPMPRHRLVAFGGGSGAPGRQGVSRPRRAEGQRVGLGARRPCGRSPPEEVYF
jgi:hypothetical protein